MWRTIPLSKMLARIVLAGMVIQAVEMFMLLVGESNFDRSMSLGEMVIDAGIHGGIFSLIVAVPMILVTALCFREIRRPLFYRFAMVTVALIVLIETILRPSLSFIQHALFSPDGSPWMLKIIALMLISQAAVVFACSLAAREYVGEIQQRKLARQEQVAKPYRKQQ